MFTDGVATIRKFDWPLLIAVFILVCFGLAAIYSVGLSQDDAAQTNFKKQIAFAAVGFLLLFAVGVTKYSAWRVYSRLLYLLIVILLVLVLFFGQTVRGTQGWFSVLGFRFQPVELAKLAGIVVLARFFSNRFHYFFESKQVLVSLAITLLLVVPVLMQPDLGSAIVIMGIWFILLALTGVSKKYWIALLVISILGSWLAWGFLLADYQKDRIMTFVDPSHDPLGSGYNVSQAIVGIGSGQMFGRGLGFGSQSQLKFIPESQTDFIFAVIAEEFGFAGVAVIIGLWTFIFYRLIMIARRAPDDFGLYLTLGIVCLFLLHFIINIGMNMGISPVTGISLPFLSYGGSFLVISLLLVGMAESVAASR